MGGESSWEPPANPPTTPPNVSGTALEVHAEKLKTWIFSEDGFGSWLDVFFRQNGQYFEAYQEEHALHYTTLWKQFADKFEAEVQGWLADEHLTENHLEEILLAGRHGGDT